MQKTNEQFIAEAKAKFPHIEVLSDYISSKDVITFHCTKHNYTFSKPATYFIHSDCGCNMCAKEKISSSKRKTDKWFSEQLIKRNPNVEQLSPYVNMQKKVKVKCKKCGKIYESKAQDLLNGHSCKDCSIKKITQNRIKSHNWFIENLMKYNPNYDNIEILNQYSGTNNLIKCRCRICSYVWQTKANNLIDKRGGTGCPICKQSKGELAICNYLKENNIIFERQKEFPNLIGHYGFPLSYDFYIPNRNILIEVNGAQHYMPIKHFGGNRKYRIQKEHDDRKRAYANKYGYKLLEIKYTDSKCTDKIIHILQNEL